MIFVINNLYVLYKFANLVGVIEVLNIFLRILFIIDLVVYFSIPEQNFIISLLIIFAFYLFSLINLLLKISIYLLPLTIKRGNLVKLVLYTFMLMWLEILGAHFLVLVRLIVLEKFLSLHVFVCRTVVTDLFLNKDFYRSIS